jgi:hypothetical protein
MVSAEVRPCGEPWPTAPEPRIPSRVAYAAGDGGMPIFTGPARRKRMGLS